MTAEYTIFYDGRCNICSRGKRIVQRMRAADCVRFVDINDARAMRPFPMVSPAAAQEQVHVLDPAGQLVGGYDAWLRMVPVLTGMRLVPKLLQWGPLHRLGWRFYRWVARNRYWLSGGPIACGITSPRPAASL